MYDSIYIGTNTQMCNVVLTDPLVSSIHAKVVRNGARQVVISDWGSLNGTWLNGTRITKPMFLTPGDELRIGSKTVTIPPEIWQ